MGPLKGPRALLLIAALTFCTSWILSARPQTELPAATKCTDERTGQAELPLALHARRQLRWDYGNMSLDDIAQRKALLALYSATNGRGWKTANVSSIGAMPWGTEGVSYCRWYGVTCCASSPLSQVDCSGLHSVVILSLDGFGLAGYVPAALGSLPELTVLGLANNPKLGGTLPRSLSSLPHLLWLSVEDTEIVACMEASSDGGPTRGALPAPVKGPCSLSPGLEFTDSSYYPFGVNEYLCPAVVLSSFLAYTSNLSPDMWDLVTLPFPAPSTPGAVIAGGSFTFYYNCACRDARHTLEVQDSSGYASAVCVGQNEWQRRRTGIIVALVLLPVTLLLVAGCVYICAVHKATLNRLVRRKEAEMARKRSKVPGTPARVLQNGRGVLELSDVIVTWVVTDVAASTQLWEWKPDVMDRAIDLHNAAMRALMDEFGGHEIRNEGDSFTLSFHDAVDAVTFCLKAQEKLMNVDWPKELAEHPQTGAVTVGDVTCNPEAAGKGPPLMNGLRVRMGVNTGVPDDIFLHDMTDHVDYRGLAYDLAGEICDLAEGGQVLLGPQTIRRWNKVNYTALNDNLIADLLREQHGGSFVQPSVMHGASGRRGSITGFGGAPGSGLLMGLGRESQQLQAHYGSNAGTATGMAMLGATGYGLSAALPVMRPHSDSQPQPPAQNPSETEEAGDDDLSAAGGPNNWSLKLPTVRSMRMHRNSSPMWQMRMGAPAFRNMTRSSDGAPTAAGGANSPGQGMKIALNHGPPPRQSSRGKAGSPHANTFSKTSQNEGTQRGRLSTATGVAGGGSAAASGGEESDGHQGARPFKRVNSTDGLLRLHAARAAELAAAAQAPAAAAMSAAGKTDGLPVVAFGASNSRGSNGRRPSQVDDSDDDRSSPRPLSPTRHASGHLSMLGLRIAAAQASTGSGGDGRNSAGGRRRGDDTEASGKSVVSAPIPVGPVLQRWLSQGWRNLALPSRPRSQTAGLGSLASAVAAAAGSGQSQVSGGLPAAAPRISMSLGSRVMWTRMNGGAAVTGRTRAAVTSNGSTLDGPGALPVDDESPISGTPVGSARVLDRVSSQPINHTSMSRLAAPPRRSEPTSKESYLRQQPGTFLSLTYHSREDSREIKPEGSQNSSAHARPDSLSSAQRPLASDAHPTSLVASPGSADQDVMLNKPLSGRAAGHTATSAPLSMVMPTGPAPNNAGPSLADVSRLTRISSRRMPVGMPGPPRMSLASEPGLHPLLLNPMQPGGLAVVQMPGRLSLLRHPQQLGPRTAGPSPLRALQHMTGEQGNGTTLATGHDPSFRAGESLTNATGSASRRTPSGPSNRCPIDLRAGSVDGGGGTRGDSGSPLRPHSVGQQPYAQMSYQQYGAQGGYYAFESPAVDPISGAVGYERLHMRDLLRRLWARLLSAFLLLFHRCLRCVRLLTSSDDDPADVGMWGATDGTVLGGAAGGSRAATGGSKPQQIKGVLVDMGYYQFLTVDYQGQAPAAHKVHLMQIVPDSVAPRVLMFPWPLSLPPGWEKISPGFFDAPGSSRLLYPAMRELLTGDLQAQRPVVTVAFASIEGFKDLSAVSVDLARDVLQLHSAAVRETLSTCSGYECKEFNGSFMTTFTAPTSAVEWALTLQLALVALPWPDELLTCEAAAVVYNSEDDMVLFRGLRCRVGIYAGPIDRVTPHPKTGRADYFGQPVNRAARLMTAAQGGQVVLDQSLLDEVLEEWRRRQEVRRLATIPSVDETSAIDELGSLAGGPSEMRTARSFVSARSIGRLTKQQSMLVGGGASGAMVSNPSANIVTELSLQQPNSRGDGFGAPATTPTALSTDQLCTISPFNSQGGSAVAKAITSIGAFRDGGTDGSSSPHISAACAASPTESNGGALAAGGGGHSSEGPMTSHAEVPARHERISSSNAASIARSLDRILMDQRVQRSARSEPRIQRVTRFGLGGLTTMLRGGGGGRTHGGNASVDASEIIRSNCGGSSVAVPRSPLAQPPDTSPKSLQVTVSSPAPWFTESPSVSVAAAMAAIQGRSRSFLHRTGGGGSGAGARCLSQATAPVGGSITSGSFGGAVAAGGGTSTQSTAQLVSWGANTGAHSHGSPAGSMQSSTAGAAGSEQPSMLRLAPGLELQPVVWDPAARSTSAAVAARIRRGRRASVGGIVENMLLGARRMNSGMVQGSPGSHLASSVSASVRSGQMSGLATPKTTRVSPATAAARARLLSDSPQTQLGSISGRRTGSVSIPATVVMLQAIGGVSNGAQTAPTYPSAYMLPVDLPDSPSATAALPGARSPASHYRAGAYVRRMGSSPLGPMAPVVQQTETVNGAWQSHADNSAHRKPSPDGSSASGYNNASIAGFHNSAPSVATLLAGTSAGLSPNAQHPQNLRSLQQRRPVSVSEPRLYRQASAGTPSTPPSMPFENAEGQPVLPGPPVSAEGHTQLLRDSPLSQTDAGESRPPALQLATQAGHAAQTSGPKSAALAAPGVPETAPTGQVLTGRHGVPGGNGVLPSLAEGRAPSWDYANDANAGSSGPLYLLETHPFRSGPEEWSSGVGSMASPGASTAQVDGGPTSYSGTQVFGTKEIILGGTAADAVVTPAGSLPAGRLARSHSQATAQAAVHGGRDMDLAGSREGKEADGGAPPQHGGEGSSQQLRRASDEPGSDRNASTQASPCLTCSDGSGSGDGMGVPLTIRMLPTVAPASASSRSSVGPSSFRPMSLGSGAASSVRQPLSERSSPQPGNNPRSPSIPSTASSTRKWLMFERTSSAAMSCVLADSDIMPSFAVNLVSRPSAGQVAAAAASANDNEAALAVDGTSAHSPASPSMCGRSFASAHVNPMYANSRKSVLSEGPIIEEDGSEAGAQSLDPFGARASLSRPVSLQRDPPSQHSSIPTSLTLLPQRSFPHRFSPSFPPRLLSTPSGLSVNDAGPRGMLMLGLPPAMGPFAPSIPVAAAAASHRRSFDGPLHPVLSGSPCSAAQGTVASGSGSLRVFGRHHLSRNSSGIAASLPITVDSPAVSDVYCTTREVVNDSPASLHTSQPAAVPMLARHMTGGRVTSAPLYGGMVPRSSLALSVGSLDAAVLGGGGGSNAPTASAGLTAASQFIPESSPAIFRDAAGGGIPPQAFITSAANRRRASSGTIMGVSLRAAAEAAIQQLQQQHHPLTPPRFLRKSTSSRGRRHVAEPRGPTGMSSSLDPGILSVAANIAGTSGGTMGHRVPLQPHSLRPSRAGMEATPSYLPLDWLSALVSPRARRSPHMFQPLERATGSPQRSVGAGSLARLPGSDSGGGSRNVAASAALRRSAPGHTPSFGTAGVGGSASSSSVSANTSQAQVLLEPARPGQRLPGTSIAPCAVAGKGAGKSAAAAASRAAPSSMPNAGCVELANMPGAGFPSTVDSCSAGGLLGMWRRSSAGSQHAHASAASPYRFSPQHQQHLLHQQHPQHLHHPTGNLSTSSAVYSRHGTNDSLGNSPRQNLTRGSTTLASGVLSRAGYRTGHMLIASAAAGTAPGIPRAAPQTSSPATTRNTPTQPSLASQPGAASASGFSGATEAPVPLLPSPAAGTTTGPSQLVVSPGAAAYNAVRVRARNQSQQDDVLSNTTQSMVREFSQSSDPAAAMLHNTTGVRGSRRRAPRGVTSGGEEAAGSGGPTGVGANNPVPEKVPAAQAAALDPATGSAAGGGGAAGLLPGGKSEKESRPAVMAECYKITQQPAGGAGAGGGEVAQSITMIKYTNLKQELERAEEGEGDDVPVPTTTLLVPTVAVEVAIWSLGSFRLKGVTEPIKIVQVLPTELEGRLAFFNKAGLNRGKARCIERRVACLNIITLQLPDVSRLSCVNMGAVATPARVGGSSDGTGGALGYGAGEAGQPQPPLPDGGDGRSYPPWTTAMDLGESIRPGTGQGVYGLQHGGYSQAGVGPSGGMYGGARGGGVAVPIVLGQINSPADAALRWGGLRGMQMSIRELESSEAGLPPISEVITPVSSPTVRSPDSALPVLLGAPSHSGAMQVHRRSYFSQPSAPLPDAPTSPSRSSAALQSRSSMPFLSRPPPPPTSDVSSGSASAPGGRVSSHQAHVTAITALSGGGSHGSQPSRYLSIGPYETAFTGGGTNAQHQTYHLHSLAPHHLPLQGIGAPWNNGTPFGGLPVIYPPSHVADTSVSLMTMRPRQQSSQGDRHSSQPRDSAGEVAITARLSTGLLPLSLSYMAPRGRDTRNSIAAMMDAGMDVRSPGESPATTVAVCLTEPDAEALQILAHGSALADAGPAADAGGGGWGLHVHVDGLQEAVQMRYNNAYSPSSAVSTPETSAAAGGAVTSAPATAAATATAMFSQDRTSAGTGTRPHSALVIDRSSSGFNHAPSSGLTPVHPWTDRSSSGRYGSSQVPPYTLIGTDRTSQRSSAQDWSSSTRLTHSSLPPCLEPGLLQLQSSTGGRAGVAAVAAAYLRFPSWGLSPHDSGTPASAVAETPQSQHEGGHGGSADEGGEGGPLPMTGRSVSHELDWQQAPSPSTIQHHPRHPQPQVLVLGSDGRSDGGQEFGPEPVGSPTSAEAHRDYVVGRAGWDVGRNERYRSSLRERHSMEHQGLSNEASGGAIGSTDGGRGDAQGSLASSPDAGASIAARMSQVPRTTASFAILEATAGSSSLGGVIATQSNGGADHFLESATNVYDITVSIRSSIAGSATAGHHSHGGGGGGVLAGLDSLRGFGLVSQLPSGSLVEPVSASELLQPFMADAASNRSVRDGGETGPRSSREGASGG